MKEVIKMVGDILSGVVNYRFLWWKKKPQYPYFVGEIFREGGSDESGETEYRFLLTGFYHGDNEMQLYEAADRILDLFPADTGRLIQCRGGGMLIASADILTELPTDTDTELTKIQITLDIKRWKGRK